MEKEELVEYYSRDDVAKEMARFAEGREFVGRFRDGGYSSRPGVVMYPNDIRRFAEQGIVSFHGSVELWENPMNLEHAKRKGWDFLIDLDSEKLELSRKVADVLIELLRAHGIKSVHTKFSGRSGFHIFVPWKAFDPSLADRFPEIPRAIGQYLENHIRTLPDELTKEERTGVEIDSVAIAPRHLMRAPYSLNEKSWLVSIPVEDSWFDLEDAKPDNVEVRPFELTAKPREAMSLVDMSLDFLNEQQYKRQKKEPRRTEVKGKVPETFFAPCIKRILQGLSDGRKRAEFILRAYLRNLGWNWGEVEDFLLKWNKKNKPPLRENYIQGHLRWHKRQKEDLLPPNHDRKEFYKDMGVYTDKCTGLKNPLSYTMRKYRTHLKYAKKDEKKDGEDSKLEGST